MLDIDFDMKKIFYFLTLVFILGSCTPNEIIDCIGNSETIINKEFELDVFSKLVVEQGIEVELVESPFFKIVVKAGNKMHPYFNFYMHDNKLHLKNNLECTVGHTKPIKVKVFTPNLDEIIFATQFKIWNSGVLNYPYLSIEQRGVGSIASADFDLTLNSTSVSISANNVTHFKLKGMSNHLNIYLWGGNARVNAEELEVSSAFILHRSSNHIYLNVRDEIKGDIYSVGHVYLTDEPVLIDVIEHYRGRLIY